MTSVLVVDDDAALRAAIARDLTRHGFRVHVAGSIDEASDALRANAVDVLLTDLRIAESDGFDLLDACRRISADTRSVLMSGYASARDYKTAVELGVVRVLCKPFTPNELLEAIHQAVDCANTFHGSMHGMSLVDILQLFHFARRSVSVHVAGTRRASIHMLQGEVVHAEMGALSGGDAFTEILKERSGAISTTVLSDVPTTVRRAFDSLLLDSLRQLDEANARSSAPDAAELTGLGWSAPPAASKWDAIRADATAAWRDAGTATFGPMSHAMVLALSLEGSDAAFLQGEGDVAAYAPLARALLGGLARLAPEGDAHCDCTTGSLGVAVVRASARGFAIALLDVLTAPSAATWFRSNVAAVARSAIGVHVSNTKAGGM